MTKQVWDELFNEKGDGFNPFDLKDDGEPAWSKVDSRKAKLQRLLNGMSDSDPRRASHEAELAELAKIWETIKPW
jgi:hypothetical protein